MNTAALALALTLAASALTAAEAGPAGLRLFELDLPHDGERTEGGIWYPSAGGGEAVVFAERPVFYGVDALMGAAIAPGKHPVVLFSHGMGGSFRSQSWLAEKLAERGAIVIGVDHPNTRSGDLDMREGVRHWTRAQDLSAALDHLQQDPEFRDHLDMSRVMAAGFSFGGWTALSLGGATGDLQGMVSACTEYGSRMEACDVLMSPQVNMPGIDPALWNKSYADPRVTMVAAIDPGLIWGLGAANVTNLVPDALLIGLGEGKDRMLATDFDASGLTALLPGAQIEHIAPAFHFTMQPLCKPGAEALLREMEDDPVCSDPVGTDRAAAHAMVERLLAEQLGL